MVLYELVAPKENVISESPSTVPLPSSKFVMRSEYMDDVELTLNHDRKRTRTKCTSSNY